MIKEVVFDIDDTLYDYEKGHALGVERMAEYAEKELGIAKAYFRSEYKRMNEELKVRLGKTTQPPTAAASACRTCWSSGASPCFPMWRSCIICTGTLCLQRARRSREVSRPYGRFGKWASAWESARI